MSYAIKYDGDATIVMEAALKGLKAADQWLIEVETHDGDIAVGYLDDYFDQHPSREDAHGPAVLIAHVTHDGTTRTNTEEVVLIEDIAILTIP